MKKTIAISGLLTALSLVAYADCYDLLPGGNCSPPDQTASPDNGCQSFTYSPSGTAEYCNDGSLIENFLGGYQICTANTVTVTYNYTWLHEVKGKCVNDNQAFTINNIMTGLTCEQDYIPGMAATCP